MKSVWGALIWKEWHEHKWKLVALTAVLISLPAMMLLSDKPSSIFTAATAMLFLPVPVVSIFIGASASAGENSGRTMPYLQSLPTPMPRVAAVKLAVAILTICISVACLIAFVYVVNAIAILFDPAFARNTAEDRAFVFFGVNNWYLSRFLLGSLAGTSLLIWVVAVGVNRSDEVRAGALGILAIVSYPLVLGLVAWRFVDFSLPFSGFPIWFKTLGAIGPGGPIVLMWLENFESPSIPPLASSWPRLFASFAFHALLAALFIVRFGRVSQPLRRSELTVTVNVGDWLAPPRRTKVGALVWKQFRESGPLALVAMCMVFAFGMIYAAAIYQAEPEWNRVVAGDWFAFVATIWMFLGFFVAIVAGIGVFFEELRPGMDTFWRSRPINRDLWFWIKFSFGMGITLLALVIPVLIALALTADQINRFSGTNNFDLGVLVFLIQATVFATAALAMLLVRQAIYAAVIAIGSIVGLTYIGGVYLNWETTGATLGFAISALLATLLAWLAVRYDWSLRR